MINFKEYISKHATTDISKELVKKLYEIWNNPEFVFCVLHSVDSEQNCKSMLNFIKKYGEDVDLINVASHFIENDEYDVLINAIDKVKTKQGAIPLNLLIQYLGYDLLWE